MNDVLIRHQIGFDQFDRHLPSGMRITRQQHNAHAPTTEHPQNFKLIQQGKQAWP